MSADGRRSAQAPVVDAAALDAASGLTVVLDHAGPCAASWSVERPWGTEIPTPLEGRTPKALDDAGWSAVTRAFVDAADACRAAGVPWALGLDDDGLLHDALRHTPRRALDVVTAVRPTVVVLPVEDLMPGGLDATDGIELARAVVALGVKTVVASAGSRALAPLRWRRKGGSEATSATAALASAQWLVGRVDAEIVALIPSMASTPPAPPGVARVLVETAVSA